MIARVRDGRLHIFFEASAAGDPIVSQAGGTLRIGLVIRNPVFATITAASVGSRAAMPLYQNPPDATARLRT